MDTIVAWMVALIVSVAPAGRAPASPEGKETQEETYKRYESIAKDLVSVVYDVNEKPLFAGPQGRAKTAAVLLAIARFESDFRKDVDLGLGPLARGDGGRSWCLGQINLGEPDGDTTPRRVFVDQRGYFTWSGEDQFGYSGQDLVSDRRKCFRAMLWMVRTSFTICNRVHENPMFLLNLYAGGEGCLTGHEASEKRMGLAGKWMTHKKFPTTKDAEVTALVTPQTLPLPLATLPKSHFKQDPAMVSYRRSALLPARRPVVALTP